jgi:hypothetical protein
MKLVMRFGAAMSLAAFSACSQTGQDNSAQNMDSGSAMAANESALPATDNAAGADTLGNQLNQLNEGGNLENSADNSAADTTTNAE